MAEARLGNYEEAHRLLTTLTGLSEPVRWGASLRDLAYLNLGRVAYQQGLFEEAISYYRKVSVHSRLWPQATYERAWAALAAGHLEEALGSVLALRSPVVRPQVFRDAWVVEVGALLLRCWFTEASGYARAWSKALQRVIEDYRSRAPEAMALAERCGFSCIDRIAERVDPGKFAVWFPWLLTSPDLYSTYVEARAALRERIVLESLGKRMLVLQGLVRLGKGAADSAMSRLRRGLARALVEDLVSTRLAQARAMEVEVDLERRAIETYMREARQLAGGEEGLPVPLLLAEIKKMARLGVPDGKIKVFLSTKGRGIALSEHEIEELRRAGLSPGVLDFVYKYFTKPWSMGPEVDPLGEDPRVMWSYDAEFWADEVIRYRIQIGDRCRAIAGP